MPEMDGLQATRAIRLRGGRLATVPIIAFTANAFAEDIQSCRDAGMNDFVIKPMRKAVLIETIVRVLVGADPSTPGVVAPHGAPSIAPAQPESAAAEESAQRYREAFREYPILDRAVFDELAEAIGEEGICELLDVFIEDTAARVAVLKRQSGPLDREEIERVAHALKGASGTLGLKRLSASARTLEAEAPGISEAEFNAILTQIEQAFAAGRSEIPAQFGAVS